MDPVIGGALIQAGSGLLGSLFGKKGLSPSQVIESNAIGYRHFGEMYGFNPLTLMGANMVQPGQAPPNYLGEAISDAGMMLADAYAKRTDAQKVSRLEERNRKLQEEVQSLTLRPKVGGVYAQTERTPTSAQALGVSDAASSDANADRLYKDSPLAGDIVGPGDDNLTGPQLAVKKDVPAFRMFGHDFYGTGLFSTGQQMEDSVGEGPLSWLYSPVVVGDALLNESYKLGGAIGDRARASGGPVYRMEDGQSYALLPPKRKPKPKQKSKHPLKALGF